MSDCPLHIVYIRFVGMSFRTYTPRIILPHFLCTYVSSRIPFVTAHRSQFLTPCTVLFLLGVQRVYPWGSNLSKGNTCLQLHCTRRGTAGVPTQGEGGVLFPWGPLENPRAGTATRAVQGKGGGAAMSGPTPRLPFLTASEEVSARIPLCSSSFRDSRNIKCRWRQ